MEGVPQSINLRKLNNIMPKKGIFIANLRLNLNLIIFENNGGEIKWRVSLRVLI